MDVCVGVCVFGCVCVCVCVWVGVCVGVARARVVSIATRYGLDAPGIESRLGTKSLHPSRPALELTQPPIQWVPVRSLV
jgi:hypothetical protein